MVRLKQMIMLKQSIKTVQHSVAKLMMLISLTLDSIVLACYETGRSKTKLVVLPIQ